MMSSKDFIEAKKYIPGGVNSPVRSFKAVNSSPLFIKKARGSKMYDEDNNRYIDYCKEITAAYIYTRYPEMPKIDNIEKSSKDYIKKAEEILKWIKKHL